MLSSLVVLYLLGLTSLSWAETTPFTCSGVNRGFVFVKPNAVTPSAISLVKSKLASFGIEVVDEGTLAAKEIDERGLIDTHYGSIASKAVQLSPRELMVTPEASAKFLAVFDEPYEAALAAGKVLSAKEACAALAVDEAGLGNAWEALKAGTSLVKFGGGFYAGRINEYYVINGFYMAMRALYVTPPASIVWMCVEWPESSLSWKAFRADVVGATDPRKASASSIRRALFDAWRDLGLPGEPSVKENGLHASASPLEALAERANWLGLQGLRADPFAAELLGALTAEAPNPGMTDAAAQSEVRSWFADPPAKGDGPGGLFDLLEDMDTSECITALLGQVQ